MHFLPILITREGVIISKIKIQGCLVFVRFAMKEITGLLVVSLQYCYISQFQAYLNVLVLAVSLDN